MSVNPGEQWEGEAGFWTKTRIWLNPGPLPEALKLSLSRNFGGVGIFPLSEIIRDGHNTIVKLYGQE